MAKVVFHSGSDYDKVAQHVLGGMQDGPEHIFVDVLHRVDEKTVVTLQRMQEAGLFKTCKSWAVTLMNCLQCQKESSSDTLSLEGILG